MHKPLVRPLVRSALAALVTGMLLPAGAALAQSWPTKPVKIIVSFPAGGATDIIGRILAQDMTKSLGQNVLVENRAGASGAIGTEAVAKSAPDGYTVLFSAGGSLTISPHFGKLPYDPLKDLAPVSLVVTNDGILVVSPGFPAANPKEFIAAVKKAPGKYSFASSGTGGPTHLTGELLKNVAGLDMVHVPYKGDGPASIDVMGGQTPIMVTVLASIATHVRSGKLKPVAALGATRFPQLPDLPTMAESGFPGFTGGTWLGMLAPAGTPGDVVIKLNEHVRRSVALPETREKLIAQGATPNTNSPQEFATHIREEYAKWARVIQTANIKLDQ